MDNTRFDEITREFATGVPRRKVLLGLLGGALGVVGVGQARADSPQRKCKQASRPCSFDTHCCSGTCCNHRCCGPGQICDGNGECACAPDNVAACGGRECGSAVNICGQTISCGTCPSGETCNAAGACEGPTVATCTASICGEVSTCATGCICATSISGEGVCVQIGHPGLCAGTCTSDADCDGGVCTTSSCCGGQQHCVSAESIAACAP